MGLNTITKMRLPNGMEVALVDWTDKPLFSTVDLETGFTTQEINLFQYVVGDPVASASPAAATRRTATERDTNISTPGAMASTEEMLVYSIKVEYHELQLASTGVFTGATPTGIGQPMPQVQRLAELNRLLLLRLIISQKEYVNAPLGQFMTGYGPHGSAAVSTDIDNANLAVLGNQGQPQQNAVRSFVIPHHIGGQEKYRVSLVNPGGGAVNFGLTMADATAVTALTVMRATVLLDGLYKRPVS